MHLKHSIGKCVLQGGSGSCWGDYSSGRAHILLSFTVKYYQLLSATVTYYQLLSVTVTYCHTTCPCWSRYGKSAGTTWQVAQEKGLRGLFLVFCQFVELCCMLPEVPYSINLVLQRFHEDLRIFTSSSGCQAQPSLVISFPPPSPETPKASSLLL